jgi:ferredoxin
MTSPIELNEMEPEFKAVLQERLPSANFDLCLTCGTCTAGCPASELFDTDPRKLVRMLVLGLDEEIAKTPWAWVCTMCTRCVNACPMKVDIPKLVYNMRAGWPRDKRPKGILGSCDMHIRAGNAMGVPTEDFIWTVTDVADESARPSRASKTCRSAWIGLGPTWPSIRIPGNRSPNPMNSVRCGRSCTWWVPTGLTRR